jgi:hypothetical protein
VPSDKFKVFISWSGALSMRVAAVWPDLIRDTFDVVEPFMSEESIGAGERNLFKIATKLAGTRFGIIVVTQDNQNSQWLNYEAGALSKDLDDSTVRVAPLLVDFDRKSDVTGPLGQFQASLLDYDGAAYILNELAKVVGADTEAIVRRLRNAWPEYESRFATATVSGAAQPASAHRRPGDMLDEVLTLVRDIARAANSQIMPNAPIKVKPFGPSYGTLSEEFVSGLVMAVVDDYPGKAGEVMRTELLHRSDGTPRAVIKSSYEIPQDYRDRIVRLLKSSWRIAEVTFEDLPVQRH